MFVGAKIIDATLDIYYETFFQDFSEANSEGTISVEWQVFDTIDRKVILKMTTEGSAKTTEQSTAIAAALGMAYENALLKLLASDEFRKLVMAGNSSAIPVTADLGAYQYSVASQNDRRSMGKVQESVVTILVGIKHGSGFVVSNNGLIITNQHVVGNSEKVYVTAFDGTKYEGRVVARDARRDVAAVVVNNLSLPFLKMRLSAVNIGEDVYAVGSPTDVSLFGTVTKGVISSNRTMDNQSWIQSDATINPGNSGGPLVDAKGNVVGISTLARNDAKGIFFFVPIADAFIKLNISGK